MPIDYTSIVIIGAGLAGFLIARHIRAKKKEQKPFVCPLQFDCHKVVTSDYSKFLGIPLELWGMAYYAFIIVAYSSFLVSPGLKTSSVVYFIMVLTAFSFLFSVYLTAIQAFRLRQWCSWCLFSAALCTVILISGTVGFIQWSDTLFLSNLV
jgi:uncharacterized membrane protein